MPKFEGCIEAREISLTRKAAVPGAAVLVLKNSAGKAGATSEPENPDMTGAVSADVTKAATAIASVMVAKTATWGDVTKAYFAGLTGDAQTAFLEKSAEDQKTEAEAAKAATDKAALEAEAAKSGKTARELELEKNAAADRKRIEDLEKRLAEGDIEKRAASEFANFPGGVAAAVQVLKDISGLPEDARKRQEDLMKAQCAAAAASTVALGGRTDQDVEKSVGAKRRLEEAAKKYATDHNVSFGDAFIAVTEKSEHAEDVRLANG